MESNWPLASQVEVKALPRPGFLLQQVHTLYRAQFLRWLAIMAPTSVLASLVILLSDQQVKAIFRSMPRGETRYHAGEVVQALALRSGGFFVSWLLGHQRARAFRKHSARSRVYILCFPAGPDCGPICRVCRIQVGRLVTLFTIHSSCDIGPLCHGRQHRQLARSHDSHYPRGKHHSLGGAQEECGF